MDWLGVGQYPVEIKEDRIVRESQWDNRVEEVALRCIMKRFYYFYIKTFLANIVNAIQGPKSIIKKR